MTEIYERAERDKITQRLEELAQDLDALQLGPVQTALGKIAQIRPELDTKVGTERLKATEEEITCLNRQMLRIERRLNEIPEMRYVQRRLGEIERILKEHHIDESSPDTKSIDITVTDIEVRGTSDSKVCITFSNGRKTTIDLAQWYALNKLFTEKPNE